MGGGVSYAPCMRAFTSIRGPGGATAILEHGDFIGRLRRSALVIDDPRVSEAHALVSLRGDRLKLLPLRGRLFVKGEAEAEVTLEEGLEIALATGVDDPPRVIVDELFLPEAVLAVEADGLARAVLAGVASLQVAPRPRLVAGYVPGADAVMWGEGASWTLTTRDGEAVAIAPGATVDVAALTLRFVEVPIGEGGAPQTIGTPSPLRIISSYESVAIHGAHGVALLAGVPARIISELGAFDGPAPWEVLAGEVWGRGIERDQLRARLDMALLRVRKRLREAGVRDDLVVATGTGQVQLLLRPGDVLDDRS